MTEKFQDRAPDEFGNSPPAEPMATTDNMSGYSTAFEMGMGVPPEPSLETEIQKQHRKPSQKAIEALRENPQYADDFDAKYGLGAAAQHLIGKPAPPGTAVDINPATRFGPTWATKDLVEATTERPAVWHTMDTILDQEDVRIRAQRELASFRSFEAFRKGPGPTTTEKWLDSYLTVAENSYAWWKERHRKILEEGGILSPLDVEGMRVAEARLEAAKAAVADIEAGVIRQAEPQLQIILAERLAEQKVRVDSAEAQLQAYESNPELSDQTGKSKDAIEQQLIHEKKKLALLENAYDYATNQKPVEGATLPGETLRSLLRSVVSQTPELLSNFLKRIAKTSDSEVITEIVSDLTKSAKGLEKNIPSPAQPELLALDPKSPTFKRDLFLWAAHALGQGVGSTVPVIVTALTLGNIAAVGVSMTLGVGEMENALEEAFRMEGLDFDKHDRGDLVYILGSTISALDSYSALMNLGLFKREVRKLIVRNTATAIARGMAHGSVREGITEAIQQGLEIIGRITAVEKKTDWKEYAKEIIEAGAAGMVPGGVFGARGGVIENRHAKARAFLEEIQKKAEEKTRIVESETPEPSKEPITVPRTDEPKRAGRLEPPIDAAPRDPATIQQEEKPTPKVQIDADSVVKAEEDGVVPKDAIADLAEIGRIAGIDDVTASNADMVARMAMERQDGASFTPEFDEHLDKIIATKGPAPEVVPESSEEQQIRDAAAAERNSERQMEFANRERDAALAEIASLNRELAALREDAVERDALRNRLRAASERIKEAETQIERAREEKQRLLKERITRPPRTEEERRRRQAVERFIESGQPFRLADMDRMAEQMGVRRSDVLPMLEAEVVAGRLRKDTDGFYRRIPGETGLERMAKAAQRMEDLNKAIQSVAGVVPSSIKIKTFSSPQDLPETARAYVMEANAIAELDARRRLAKAKTVEEEQAAMADLKTASEFSAVEGFFWDDSIYLAEYALDPEAILTHETIHALKRLGQITDSEIQLLAEWARKNGVARDDLYRRAYQGRDNLNVLLDEEAAAHAIQERASGKSLGQEANGIADRILEFFKRLGNALRGLGFQTSEDVIHAFFSGEMARRTAMRAIMDNSDVSAIATDGDKMLAFAGAGAATANLNELSRAIDMERRGVSREEIWEKTGWFRGVDKKWRFETNDRGVIAVPQIAGTSFGYFNEFFRAPELLAAYPNLGAVRTMVDYRPYSRGEPTGSYNKIGMTAEGNLSGLAKVALHESQHFIQDTEGFARGGAFGREGRVYIGKFVDPLLDRFRQLNSVLDQVKRGQIKLATSDIITLQNEGVDLIKKIEKAAAFQAYWNLAGEVEARAVEKRMNLRPEERRKRPPWVDYDIAEIDQIVRFPASRGNVQFSEQIAEDLIKLDEKNATGFYRSESGQLMFALSQKAKRLKADGTAAQWINRNENAFKDWRPIFKEGLAGLRSRVEEMWRAKTTPDEIAKTAAVDLKIYLEEQAQIGQNGMPEVQQAIDLRRKDPEGAVRRLNEQIGQIRMAQLNGWREHLTKDSQPYKDDPFFREYAWKDVSNLRPDRPDLPLPFDAAAVADVYARVTKDPGNQSFGLLYEEALARRVEQSIAGENKVAGTSGREWIRIPRTQKTDPEFQERVKQLRSLSCKTWCTASTKAAPYLRTGDFWVLRDNGSTVMGLSFSKDKIVEIQGPANNNRVPIKYIDELDRLVEKKPDIFSRKMLRSIDEAKEAAVIAAQAEEYVKQGNLLLAARTLGHDASLRDDGMLEIVGFISSINENLEPIKDFVSHANHVVIEENSEMRNLIYADFIDIMPTSFAPNLKHSGRLITVGESVTLPKFEHAKVNVIMREGSSAPKLSYVGADVAMSVHASAPNLRLVGGKLSAVGDNDLSNLVYVGERLLIYGKAKLNSLELVQTDLYIRDAISMPSLRYIGRSADLNVNGDYPNLEYVGGELVLRKSDLGYSMIILRSIRDLNEYPDIKEKFPKLISIGENAIETQEPSEINEIGKQELAGVNEILQSRIERLNSSIRRFLGRSSDQDDRGPMFALTRTLPDHIADRPISSNEKNDLGFYRSDSGRTMFAFANRPLPDGQTRVPWPGLGMPPKPLPELLTDLNKALGLTTRVGRLNPGLKAAAGAGGGTLLGQYNAATGIARLRVPLDMDTLAHEGGHAIEERFGLPLRNLMELHRSELEAIATPGRDQLSEGFADFFRRYITNPSLAENRAPRFYRAFNDFVETEDATLLAALQAVQDGYQAWIDAPSGGIVKSTIVSTKKPSLVGEMTKHVQRNGFKEAALHYFNGIYTTFLDNRHPIQVATNRLLELAERNLIVPLTPRRRIAVPAARDPYKLLRLARLAYQGGDMDLMRGVLPYNGTKHEGPSLHDAIGRAMGGFEESQWTDDKIRDFGAYLTARRMVAEWDRFRSGQLETPPDKLSREDHAQAIRDYETAFPEFIDAASMVYEYLGNLLRKAYEAGFIPKDVYDTLRSRRDYVPVNRNMEEDASLSPESLAARARGSGKSNPLKRFHGSTRDIINPLESIIRTTYEWNMVIARNEAIRALDRLARSVGPGGGAIAERIPATEIRGTAVNVVDLVKSAARQNGVSAEDLLFLTSTLEEHLGEDAETVLMRPGEISEKGEPIVYLWEEGKRIPIRLADGKFGRWMYESITELGHEMMAPIFEFISRPTQWLRAGITLDPAYTMANYTRDNMQAWALTRDHGIFAPNLAASLTAATHVARDAFGQTVPDLDLYRALGGITGGIGKEGLNEARIKRDVAGLRRKGIRFGEALPHNKAFWELTGITESGTRLAVFREARDRAMRDGLTEREAIIEAAYATNDLLDFGRHGSRMLTIKRLIIFLNANLQGMDKSIRTLLGFTEDVRYMSDINSPYLRQADGAVLTVAERQKVPLAAMAWMKVVLGMGFLGFLMSFAYRDDDEYKEIPEYFRTTHWVFRDPTGTWRRIPKPFELTIPSLIVERAFEAYYLRDGKAMERLREGIGRLVIPPHVVPGVNLAYELWANKSGFTGAAIVPEHLRALPPELQFTAYTSELSKWLAQMTGVSAAKLDHAIAGTFGSLGRVALDASNAVMPRMGRALEFMGLPTFGLPTIERPPLRQTEMIFVRRFTIDPIKSAQAKKDFWDLMSQTSGSYVQKAKGYQEFYDRGQFAAAEDFLKRMNENERAYALLEGHARPAQKRLHPLTRARQVLSVTNGIRRDLETGELKDPDGNPYSLSDRRVIQEMLEQIQMREARNALVVMGEKGYENKRILPVDPILSELEAKVPSISEELNFRLREAKVRDFEDVRSEWPELKAEVLDPGYAQDHIPRRKSGRRAP